jgi:hypothetical protein
LGSNGSNVKAPVHRFIINPKTILGWRKLKSEGKEYFARGRPHIYDEEG